LPQEAIELLSWYGLNDSDPDRDLWREEDSTGRRWYDGDPFFHGINTVRGAVAEAVAALIFARPERIDVLMDTIEHLVGDPMAAVRACAAEICTAILLRDASRAVRLFHKLIDSDEALLGTFHVERFLGVALRENFANLQPAVERMLSSEHVAVAQAGARRACLAAFDVPEAAGLAERALAGRGPLRLGAAQIYAANLVSGADHAACDAALRRLFDDPETEVRAAAINFLDRLSLEDLRSVEPLLRVLIHSAAFAEADDQLLRLLEQTPGHVPALLLDAVGCFLTLRSQEASDTTTRAAATASEVGQLLVRAYSQSDDDEFRHQSLDLIDALIGHEAYGIDRALELLGR
jgi:hypothetical protein